MKQRARRRLVTAVAGTCLFFVFVSAGSAHAIDKKGVIEKARASYYSLKSNGLVQFQCDISPDWDALLADVGKTDPERVASTIRLLKQLRFAVSLGTTGSAKVTHTTVAASNEEMAKRLNQIYGGMEQMVSGFFDTWAPFMVTSPLPEADSNYRLDERSGEWNLSYEEGPAQVATTLSKDLAIRALRVTTPDFDSTLRPQFFLSPQGFLLSGYQAEYNGKSPGEATKVNARIAYQEIEGLQLPRTLGLDGSYGASTFQILVTFSGCKATKR
jgi:hypothetical protein